jgi:hypothetical protein
VVRQSDSRNTHLRRRLLQLNLPLMSVLNRVRRGLVLCDEDEFVRALQAVVERFRSGVRSLVRSLKNGERTESLMALLDM